MTLPERVRFAPERSTADGDTARNRSAVSPSFQLTLPELPSMKTYYDILGVPPEADQDEVKSAFRKVVKAVHPDLNSGDQFAEQRSKQINRAYEILKDPKRRERYDSQLRHKRSRLRILAITMVVSAGLVSTGTLILLSFFIKSDTGAPVVARISTPHTDRLANATDQAANRGDHAKAAPPVTGPSASADAQPVQAAAAREAAWLNIEKAGGPEEIWAFVRANPGTPEAALAAKRLQTLAANEDANQGASVPLSRMRRFSPPRLLKRPRRPSSRRASLRMRVR
jgi:curved DNA-binding protein CbpA